MPISHIAVLDPPNEGVGYLEFNLEDPIIKEYFSLLFNFESDSLEDIPEVNGIREFVDELGFTILVSTSFETLEAACAARLKIAA